MKLFVSVLVLAAAASAFPLADHIGNNNRNNQGNRRLRQGRRFRQNNRPVQVQNDNPFVAAAPVAARPITQVVQNSPVVPVVNNSPVRTSVPVVSSVPRRGKSIDVEGTQFVNNSPDEFGNYNFRLEGNDGSFRQESGQQIPVGRDGDSVNEIQGEVSWISPEGELVSFTYVANENGYQPSNLPQAPAVSPAIQRGLDLIARVNARNGVN